MTKHLGNKSYFDNAVFDIILRNPDSARKTKHLKYLKNNLDVKVLDHRGLKKVIKLFERRYAKEAASRRVGAEALGHSKYTKQKCLNMIRQSIHYVKNRMNDTKSFRQRYKKHYSYQIAVLYGAATAIINKMESLFGQMKRLPWETHFLWFLVIYEKLLACNIDLTNFVERIFLIHEKYLVFRGARERFTKKARKDPYGQKSPPMDIRK